MDTARGRRNQVLAGEGMEGCFNRLEPKASPRSSNRTEGGGRNQVSQTSMSRLEFLVIFLSFNFEDVWSISIWTGID